MGVESPVTVIPSTTVDGARLTFKFCSITIHLTIVYEWKYIRYVHANLYARQSKNPDRKKQKSIPSNFKKSKSLHTV